MKNFILSILMGSSSLLFAQDPYFVQFNSAPTYLNPALIGATGHARINTSYRNQWSALNAYNTFGLSTDFYSNKLKSGFGLRYMNDNAGSIIFTNTLALGYAKYLNINDKISVQIGVEGAYQNKKVDASKLTFGDMIDPKRGFVYTSNSPKNFSSSIFDINTGIEVFAKKWFAGFAVQHLAEPNESVVGGNAPLPRKYTLNGGFKVAISATPHNFSITPEIIYQQQQDFTDMWGILNLQYKNWLVGVGFGSNSSYILSFGFNNKKFSVSYSYDIMKNDFGNSTGGSHEIHLGYIFKWFDKTQVVPFDFTSF